MHEFQIGDFVVQLNNWQFGTVFFLFLSGMGAVAAGLMVVADIIRWSLQ